MPKALLYVPDPLCPYSKEEEKTEEATGRRRQSGLKLPRRTKEKPFEAAVLNIVSDDDQE